MIRFIDQSEYINLYDHNEILNHKFRKECMYCIRHENIPPSFTRMPSFFGYVTEDYKTVRVNNNTVSVRHLKLKYFREHIHVDGEDCFCPHDYNNQLCHGWNLYQYRFRQVILFCLSWKLGGERAQIQREKSDRDEFEGKDEDRVHSPPKKRILGKARKPLAIEKMTSEINHGLNNGSSVMDQLDALYEFNCDFTNLDM